MSESETVVEGIYAFFPQYEELARDLESLISNEIYDNEFFDVIRAARTPLAYQNHDMTMCVRKLVHSGLAQVQRACERAAGDVFDIWFTHKPEVKVQTADGKATLMLKPAIYLVIEGPRPDGRLWPRRLIPVISGDFSI